jgi:hypothetical protein
MKSWSWGDASVLDEPRSWVGGEAALDPRTAHHVRRRESRSRGHMKIVAGVTFAAGLALGMAVGILWRRR